MSSFRLVLVSAALLSACAAIPGGKSPPVKDIDTIIADAATQATNANVAVSEVEIAVAAPKRAGPGQTLPPGVLLPAELSQPIDIDWQGPVEPLVQALADRAGYSFRAIGRRPATSATVALSRRQVPLQDLIREVGTMVDDSADVVLNPALRLIELRYGNT